MDKVESTKQAAKISKRRRATIAAVAIQETSERVRIYSEQENAVSTPIVNEQSTPSTTENVPKKRRGPTQVKMITGNNYQKMDLEFNECGQVVGNNSDKFSSIVGAMVREHVPVILTDWHSVDEKKKKELWSIVQQRFNVGDCHKKMTFQCMGKYWRTYKCRLRKQIRGQVKSSLNRTRTTNLLRPKNVLSQEEWEKFVEDTLSNNFNEISSKFSGMRNNQKLLHTMGRKGYPRVAHEMRKNNPDIKGIRTKVWTQGHLRKDGTPINEAVAETLKKIEDCAQSISDTPAEDSIRDDAVARVLGPENRGRVRGFGFGVAPSKFDIQFQSTGRVKELENQLQTQSQKLQTQSEKLQTQSEKMESLEEKVEALIRLCQQNVEDRGSHVYTPQSHQGSGVQGGTYMENARCQLLHWYKYDEEEIVAEGKIATTDPSAKVHHMPLGRDCWKVWVEEVYMSHLALYRPTDEFRLLSEAMGSTVAWPKSCIRLI